MKSASFIQRLCCVPLFFLSAMSIHVHAEEPATATVTVALSSVGGCRLLGVLVPSQSLALESEGSAKPLDTTKVAKIIFGERFEATLQNDALAAMDGLQSAEFDVREKAAAKLRTLGRAAIPALRGALESPDPEVSNRARDMLAELTIQNTADISSDRVMYADGIVVKGRISPEVFTVRTRFGVLKMPVAMLSMLEFVKRERVDMERLAAADEPVIVLSASAARGEEGSKAEVLAVVAERWAVYEENQRINPLQMQQKLAQTKAGMQLLTMDMLPAKNGNPITAQEGADLQDAYAALGVLLRPMQGASVKASADELGIRGSLSGRIQGDCDLRFIMPGTFGRDDTESMGGVNAVGAIVRGSGPLSIGLAVYDRNGRQLAEVFNSGAAGAAIPDEFLGVKSAIPIVRARFFRQGDAAGNDLLLDDIVFDRIVPASRPEHFDWMRLVSGDELAGDFVDASAGVLRMKLEIFSRAVPQPTVQRGLSEIKLEELESFEPARTIVKQSPGEKKSERKPRPVSGTAHGVLLQSGECFRATVLKLDDKQAVFILPGGAELALPRTVLRKIDLTPPVGEPGAAAAATSVDEDEKPGVDFHRKEPAFSDGGDGKPMTEKNEKKKDVLHGTQKLERMDNAEILALDLREGELTVKDDVGDFTIGLELVRTLVFAADPNAKQAQAKYREWTLTLRQGSRFDVTLLELSPQAVIAEMAGGTISLPLHVVESITRK